MPTKLTIQAGQYTSKGRKERNEDCSGILIPDDHLLLTKGIAVAIADGMSGSDAGDIASNTAIKSFLSDYHSTPESWSVKKSASKIITSINLWLYHHGQKDYGSTKGMVTTFSSIIFKSTSAFIFHIVDSKILRIRDGKIKTLTNEHRIHISRDRDYLSRALGIDSILQIDYTMTDIRRGDYYFLATDGIHDFISDKALLEQVANSGENLDLTCKQIADIAWENGSDDNLTCQLVYIEQPGSMTEDEFFKQLTSLPFPPPLENGMILDGYKVIRELHATKHIQVYLAEDSESGEKVVLKTPSVNFEDDPVYIDMFVHEEWVGKRIHNPHVMRVCENKRQRTFLYYVAEYLPGQTLTQWLDDQKQVKLNDVRNILDQLIKGLRAFHRLDMVHQDIKPDNIIISSDGIVKIVDFGSTRIPGIEEITTPIERNTLVGTVNYIAPEYYQGHKGNNQSDIYSLGVLIYYLLSKQYPYGDEPSEKLIKNNALEYKPLSAINPEVPAWVDAAIQKAVHPKPSQRYSTLSEFWVDFNKPNPNLVQNQRKPLIEKDPVKFWKLIALSELILIILLIIFLHPT